jgi:hypothetical protein
MQVTLSPWRGWSAGEAKRLGVRAQRVGQFVASTLPRLGAVRDQLLAVSVQFPPRTPNTDPHVVGGDAMYFWRLNPPTK